MHELEATTEREGLWGSGGRESSKPECAAFGPLAQDFFRRILRVPPSPRKKDLTLISGGVLYGYSDWY